jgi:hypothetical protein
MKKGSAPSFTNMYSPFESNEEPPSHSQTAKMSLLGTSLASQMLIISFTHLAGGAPANRIVVNPQDAKDNPIFDASRYSSISEWFSALGRLLEIANNATKECLSRFSVEEDNSVCYGDDKWEWNAVAVICVLTVLGGVLVAVWLCCDWAQTSILLYLGDAEDEDLMLAKKTLPSEREVGLGQAELEEPDPRVDSVHSQDADKSTEAKMKDPKGRTGSVNSRTTEERLSTAPNGSAAQSSAQAYL